MPPTALALTTALVASAESTAVAPKLGTVKAAQATTAVRAARVAVAATLHAGDRDLARHTPAFCESNSTPRTSLPVQRASLAPASSWAGLAPASSWAGLAPASPPTRWRPC